MEESGEEGLWPADLAGELAGVGARGSHRSSPSPVGRGAFSLKKIRQNFLKTFTTLIRSIKYRLIIKLITWMDRKSRDESIKSN